MPSPLTGFAFALAAMAPMIAVGSVTVETSPRWRALALRWLTLALVGRAGCLLLWFAVRRILEWYPARIAVGAGSSLGGFIASVLSRPWSAP